MPYKYTLSLITNSKIVATEIFFLSYPIFNLLPPLPAGRLNLARHRLCVCALAAI